MSQRKIGRLQKRFKAFILFEEKRFPQLALLAIKAGNNEDFWSAVNILLKSFFTGDPMSIDSWTKLEFKMSNPNLLLFTDSPEHKDKELSEWVQYILHQRAESAILVKQHRITGGSESQHWSALHITAISCLPSKFSSTGSDTLVTDDVPFQIG